MDQSKSNFSSYKICVAHVAQVSLFKVTCNFKMNFDQDAATKASVLSVVLHSLYMYTLVGSFGVILVFLFSLFL